MEHWEEQDNFDETVVPESITLTNEDNHTSMSHYYISIFAIIRILCLGCYIYFEAKKTPTLYLHASQLDGVAIKKHPAIIWQHKPKIKDEAFAIATLEFFHAQLILDLNHFLGAIFESIWTNLESFLMLKLWFNREHLHIPVPNSHAPSSLTSLLRRCLPFHAPREPSSLV